MMPVTSINEHGVPVSDETLQGGFAAPSVAKDHQGGGGLYGTVKDYMAILKSLLDDDGKLLRPETVCELFAPQFPDATKFREMALETGGYQALRDVPDGVQVSYSFGGMVYLDPAEGRYADGTVTWYGMPSSTWYIDRKTGVCGMLGTMVVPPTNPGGVAVREALQKFMFSLGGKK